MEELLTILKATGGITWPAAFIFFVIKGLPQIIVSFERIFIKKVPSPVEAKINDIADNHLHDLKNCIEKLGGKVDNLNETLKRIEGTLNENSRDTAFIKAKINGGRS